MIFVKHNRTIFCTSAGRRKKTWNHPCLKTQKNRSGTEKENYLMGKTLEK